MLKAEGGPGYRTPLLFLFIISKRAVIHKLCVLKPIYLRWTLISVTGGISQIKTKTVHVNVLSDVLQRDR